LKKVRSARHFPSTAWQQKRWALQKYSGWSRTLRQVAEYNLEVATFQAERNPTRVGARPLIRLALKKLIRSANSAQLPDNTGDGLCKKKEY
jgi:hypothetical protein